MPYYIYIVKTSESSNTRSASLVSEFDVFKAAKNEVKRLRAEEPLAENRIYKITFAENTAEAEKSLTEYREQPIAKEWEK
ncbi:MAG: hypothetical protein LJE74_05230 [Proteobacteria bacterium]|jgi:hypothetical protein|nr:hypothetical protein [Pseudomonadota bacterium]